MRSLLATAILLLVATPSWARHHVPRKHAPAARHRVPARQKPPRHVRLGLVPHKKGVANLFWMTKPIEGERKDPSMDGTLKRAIPIN